MTIVFSGGTDKFLVMANDFAVELQFGAGHLEYVAGRKAFCRNGGGVVTMWGARDGNRLISHLESLDLKPDSHTVEDLAKRIRIKGASIFVEWRRKASGGEKAV